MKAHHLSRRTFIGQAAATTFGAMILPRHVLGGPGYQAPSDTLNIAAIGAGGMGATNMSQLTSENIVAICDVDTRRVEQSFYDGDGNLRENRKALKEAYDKAKWFKDFRKMLEEQKDIDLIVMGDFNTPSLDDKTFKALTRRGLQLPDSLVDLRVGDITVKGSNLGKNARYDQILHLPTLKKRFTNFGGTLDFYGSDAFIKELFPDAGYTRQQFTYQLSDHFPIWVQIDTDIDGQRLSQIVQNAKK
jgi:hypothetical protein